MTILLERWIKLKMSTAYAITWIATAFAVSVGIIVTKNADYLWAMVIPLFLSFHSESEDD